MARRSMTVLLTVVLGAGVFMGSGCFPPPLARRAPAAHVRKRPAKPHARAVWVDGHWKRQGSTRVWVKGYWKTPAKSQTKVKKQKSQTKTRQKSQTTVREKEQTKAR